MTYHNEIHMTVKSLFPPPLLTTPHELYLSSSCDGRWQKAYMLR